MLALAVQLAALCGRAIEQLQDVKLSPKGPKVELVNSRFISSVEQTSSRPYRVRSLGIMRRLRMLEIPSAELHTASHREETPSYRSAFGVFCCDCSSMYALMLLLRRLPLHLRLHLFHALVRVLACPGLLGPRGGPLCVPFLRGRLYSLGP